MMRRPVSQIDPRFKQVQIDWLGGSLRTFSALPLDPPPLVGIYDPTIRQVTYPHLVARNIPAPPNKVYIPRGTP